MGVLFLRISGKKFHFLKFLLEGYDNMALVSSYAHDADVVMVRYTKGMERDLFQLLENIAPYLKRV